MFALATTDKLWLDTLKEFELNSFVNFWTPTPWNIKSLRPGDQFYFMLKSPIRLLGGYGEFVEYKNMTVKNAWNEYGLRNGRKSKHEFISSLQKYIDKNSAKFGGVEINPNNYIVGSIILKNCQFWDDHDFKDLNDYEISFPTQVVTWKSFNQVSPILEQQIAPFSLIVDPRIPVPKTSNSRDGQSKFKSDLLKAYDNRCCISSSDIPELLEASHIQEYKSVESNHVQNGLLLRVDIHRLYDSKLISIEEDYTINVSNILTGDEYRCFHGKKITLPENPSMHPSKAALAINRREFRVVD